MKRALSLLWLLSACGDVASPADPEPVNAAGQVAEGELDLVTLRRLSPLGPPPPDPTNRVADDPAAARLGQWLFFDERLSADGSVACATCHDPAHAFSDEKSLAVGLAEGTRHAPSLINVSYGRWFGWGGRADSLWAQALGPLESPLEMGGDRVAMVRLVHSDDELRAAYEAVFGALPALGELPAHAKPMPESPKAPEHRAWEQLDGDVREAVNRVFSDLAKAIAAYERLLVRGDAPFDRFVLGVLEDDEVQRGALDAAQRRGLALFLGEANCTLCHLGPNFTDNEFHNTGAPPLGGGEALDPGRYRGAALVAADPFNAAGLYSDDPRGEAAGRTSRLRLGSETWGEFKTPGLRNLGGRGPFMHQGQFSTLDDVLHFYDTLEGSVGRSHHQEQILVPLRLAPGQLEDLQAFLGALEGLPLPLELTRRPASPR